MKELFLQLAGWHLGTSLRINLFTDNFQGYYVNERPRIATSRFRIKYLKSACEKFFFLNFANLTEKRLCWSPFFNKAAGGNLKLSEAATGNVLLKRCS